MAIRQYIGARYVPKFFENPNNTSEWLANTQYEPLTIVTYGANTYTSKKLVPASVGDPTNNPEYWVSTANFNAYIEELQSQIDDLNDDLDDTNGNVAALTTRVTSIENGLDTFALYVGNSYAMGVGEVIDNGIYYKTRHLFKNSAAVYSSGGGFTAYDSNHQTTYQNLVENYVANNPDNISKITHVIVISAIGDSRGLATSQNLSSAVTNFAAYCKAHFPNLKEIILDLAEIRSIPDLSNNNNDLKYLYNTNKVFDTVCPSAGIRYLGWTGWDAMFNASYTQDDNYHPSSAGNEILSNNFISSFYGSFSYTPKRGHRTLNYSALPGSAIILRYEFTPYTALFNADYWSLSNIPASYDAVASGAAITLTPNSAITDIPPVNSESLNITLNCNRDGSGKQIYLRVPLTYDATGLLFNGTTYTALTGNKTELSASSNAFVACNVLLDF